MRHVKKDYEVCAARYQSTMAKIGQSVATTTTTTVATSAYPTMATHPAAVLGGGGQYHNGDMSQHQHHHHRQQHEHPARSHPNSTKSIEDAEEERLKTVCCAFQKYMQCSEFTVRHACGDETALFTRKFLDKMSNTLMRMHCVDYTPESGKCRDYFSSSATPSGLVWWSSSNMVTLAIVTVLAVVNARTVQLFPGQWLGTFI
uniref:Uncharacterized protein n=1 Tax=Anopheles minimus TaxID=112268 RepID=A0A182WEJ3_9DIPT